ncbi:hypothetical protein ACHAWC_000273, partial [Mediolabrus comicus]
MTILRRSALLSSAIRCIRRSQETPTPLHRALNHCFPNKKRPDNRFSVIRTFASKETVTITYCDPEGGEHPVEAEIGKNLLDVAHDNNIELEGACGGELACSTCHLVFDQE